MIGIASRWFLINLPYHLRSFASHFEDHDGFVGRSFFTDFARANHLGLTDPLPDGGVMPGFGDLGCDSFDPGKVAPGICDFLMHTACYEMECEQEWGSPLWMRLNRIYKRTFAQAIGNLDIPADGPWATTTSEIRMLDMDCDRKPDFVVWTRDVDQTRALFYTGAFRTYTAGPFHHKHAYICCALPFPFCSFTAVLRFKNADGGGLHYSSYVPGAPRDHFLGDREAGIYLVFPHRSTFSMVRALGIRETFDAEPPGLDGVLKVCQTVGMYGQTMFKLHYRIRRRAEPATRAP